MRVPKFKKHKATGGAWIQFDSQRIYLGTYGSDEAREKYHAELARWAAWKGTAAAWTAYLEKLAEWADRKGTPEARKKFQDELTRRAAALGPAGPQPAPLTATLTRPASGEPALVSDLILAYWKQHVLEHFRKRGELTSEALNIRTSLKYLRRMFGDLPVALFDQVKLKMYRDMLIDERQSCVSTVNERVRQVREMFRWGGENKLVPESVAGALMLVKNLIDGRTRARPSQKVPPVPDDIVDQTLPFLPELAADVLRFIRLTCCRPSEPLALRPRDLMVVSADGRCRRLVDASPSPPSPPPPAADGDGESPDILSIARFKAGQTGQAAQAQTAPTGEPDAGEVWYFKVEGHKTEHKGLERRLYIGREAQGVLRPYLDRDADDYCFGHDRMGRSCRAGKPYDHGALARALKRALCKLAESRGHKLPPKPKRKRKGGEESNDGLLLDAQAGLVRIGGLAVLALASAQAQRGRRSGKPVRHRRGPRRAGPHRRPHDGAVSRQEGQGPT
ncbi:MAG TPA: hypothetical protein VNH11_27620 [Pirellulales bacterium]|nr:hypothetical protein [Pirellulales bacterium]